MTFYVMTPTFERAWENGLRPLTENKISELEAFEKISAPFRDFMVANVREKDIQLLEELSRRQTTIVQQKNPGLQVLIPRS